MNEPAPPRLTSYTSSFSLISVCVRVRMREAVGLPADQGVRDVKWQSPACSLFSPAVGKPEYQIHARNDGDEDHSQLTATRSCKR